MTRLAVYTDYTYRRTETNIYAERAFALFLVSLAKYLDEVVILGKVDPEPGRFHYQLPSATKFVELPFYSSLTRPRQALAGMARSLGSFWRILGRVDCVWLLGPHPLAVAYAGLAAVRGKSVALGVRQDFRRYVRARHPGRRWIHLAGDLLELAWRILARFVPMVAVGPALAALYPHGRTLEMTVSLVGEEDVLPAGSDHRNYDDGELRVLSVGRLEEEKNPLLLAEIIARLQRQSSRWRLLVCGEGPLEPALDERLVELGVAEHAELLGYIPLDRGLRDIYRESDVLLHVSWTEGVPQVLFEAFAARLPVVATAVGGVPGAVGDAALLIEPGDPEAAVQALVRVARDPDLRAQLADAGLRRLSARTLEAQARRVAAFLSSPGAGAPRR